MSFSRVNIYKIVADHLSTLRSADKQTYYLSDIIVFTVFPIVAAITYAIFIEPDISRNSERLGEIDSIIVASFSIFSALLFNLQMLVFSNKTGKFRDKRDDETKENYANLKRNHDASSEFIEHLFFNVSYLILISMVCVLLGLISIIFFDSSNIYINFFKILFLFNFIVNLFMCLKRIHVLFDV